MHVVLHGAELATELDNLHTLTPEYEDRHSTINMFCYDN